ncbi:MAG: twin-arginine translocase TatA/TatE family subunit [Nitrospirae bacterium]|nr:twin-arginine translocase TatA/TatE family subunit [Candidatus Troglogloeales bacterium]MBI3598367.1 twin-arginine translocase TatA/TatE family subunit [Candidatus Troglogloeales bacterium]
MFGVGFPELLVVLLIVLVVFGAGKLPEIGTGLGKALRGFKKGMAEPDEIDVTPQSSLHSQSTSDHKEDHKSPGAAGPSKETS